MSLACTCIRDCKRASLCHGVCARVCSCAVLPPKQAHIHGTDVSRCWDSNEQDYVCDSACAPKTSHILLLGVDNLFRSSECSQSVHVWSVGSTFRPEQQTTWIISLACLYDWSFWRLMSCSFFWECSVISLRIFTTILCIMEMHAKVAYYIHNFCVA